MTFVLANLDAKGSADTEGGRVYGVCADPLLGPFWCCADPLLGPFRCCADPLRTPFVAGTDGRRGADAAADGAGGGGGEARVAAIQRLAGRGDGAGGPGGHLHVPVCAARPAHPARARAHPPAGDAADAAHRGGHRQLEHHLQVRPQPLP
eukprot:1195721-Prorocentrum_minimum.AAC.2